MDVQIVYDGGFGVADIVSHAAARFRVGLEKLETYLAKGPSGASVYVFCSSLISDRQFQRVKKAVEICDGEKLFVFPTFNRKSVSRLKDLDFRDYFVLPVDGDDLRAVIKRTINHRTERSWAGLEPTTRAALKKSLACFEDCFARVRRGLPLPMDDLRLSSQHIRDAARLGDFNTWIDALANHHNYSFRHSMFVSGTLTYFAHAIGIGGGDLERLAVGGLLHDIGKSTVPLEILDKPGKLDDSEWRVMRQHPTSSREILLREHDLDPDTVSMAVHHHEKLDGTGYPDGLSGAQIKDCTRLTAIADVYSALIDKRSYKGAMSNEQALDLMAGFDGHLDMDLLGAFRNFALEAR
jgi:putative nucleotidyltransferase with HDIG domain